MTIKEIDEQIAALQKERKRIQDEDIARRIKEAESYVGMCFNLGDNEYAKVIGVPTKQWDDYFHSYYNASESPVIIVEPDGEDAMFTFDTLNVAFNINRAISQEEFNTVFEKAVARLRERVGISV